MGGLGENSSNVQKYGKGSTSTEIWYMFKDVSYSRRIEFNQGYSKKNLDRRFRNENNFFEDGSEILTD